VAETTAQGLRRTAESRPEVVLVDITLGDESGFDLARRLTGHDRGSGAAVILISTHSEADFADLIAESPAVGFLSKGDLSARAIRRIVDGGEPADPPGPAMARARPPDVPPCAPAGAVPHPSCCGGSASAYTC